tara:strand:+ start:6189 stop:7454 length:1266 start_codon:yes stop_codon:yes gene_type:complete
MTEYIYKHYQNLLTDYDFRNDDQSDSLEYSQFGTIVTNRLFTPDHTESGVTSPEDFQLRVSKEVKFFVGLNDDSSNHQYSFNFRDDNNKALINTSRDTLNLSANYVEMNALTINDNPSAVKISTDKVLQIHSANKTQIIGKAEFSNEVKMDKNLYIGQSLILQQNSYANSNVQIRIALQYNQSKDTLDIVKQVGSGIDVKRRLMARLGIGGIIGNDTTLANVPYYLSPTVTSSQFTVNANVHHALNIWRQFNNNLYYGTNVKERIGIGLSNVDEGTVFQVSGRTKINNVIIDSSSGLSGISTIGVKNINTENLTTTSNLTIDGDSFQQTITANNINFRNNGFVNNFNGNATTMKFDGKYNWLDNYQSSITLSSFDNDLGYIANIHEIPIKSGGKWRMKEDGDNLLIEKHNGAIWEEKFKFT